MNYHFGAVLILCFVVIVKKRMFDPFGFVTEHCIKTNGMNTVENAFFNQRIFGFKRLYQLFYFLPL